MRFNPDLMKPLTEAELDVMGLDRQGDTLIAFDTKEMLANPGKPFHVLAVGPLPSHKLENLIYAAPFMFQRLGDLYRTLEDLVRLTEQINAEARREGVEGGDYVANAIEQHAIAMQNRVLEARRCAIVGPVQLAQEINSEVLTRAKPKG